MNRRDRLLRNPPASFVGLTAALHQDVGTVSGPPENWPYFLEGFIADADRQSIYEYLTELLDRPDVDGADLRALLKRSRADVFFSNDGARSLLEGLRDTLKAPR